MFNSPSSLAIPAISCRTNVVEHFYYSKSNIEFTATKLRQHEFGRK